MSSLGSKEFRQVLIEVELFYKKETSLGLSLQVLRDDVNCAKGQQDLRSQFT